MLDHKRGYHLGTTVSHAIHPDILSFEGQVGGNHYLLCRMKEEEPKEEEEVKEEKQEAKAEEEEPKANKGAMRYFDTMANP